MALLATVLVPLDISIMEYVLMSAARSRASRVWIQQAAGAAVGWLAHVEMSSTTHPGSPPGRAGTT
jgi:hypothetical protein